jgi:hypothetical protein
MRPNVDGLTLRPVKTFLTVGSGILVADTKSDGFMQARAIANSSFFLLAFKPFTSKQTYISLLSHNNRVKQVCQVKKVYFSEKSIDFGLFLCYSSV